MTRSVFNHRRSGVVVLSTDTFDRANSTTALGQTNGLGAPGPGILDPLTWVQRKGTWGIRTNQAYTSASTVTAIATVNLLTADVDLSLDVSPTNNPPQSGICFRFTDTSNFWTVRNNGGNVQLTKVVAGSFTNFTDGTNFIGDRWRVNASGSAINVYRNGVLKITVTDSFNVTATNHGLYRDNTTTDGADNWTAVQA